MLKKKSKYVMAILGATGAVGKETLDILEERKFPLESLRLFASKRSAGGTLSCQGKEWTIEELTPETSFAGVDFALISATDAISRDYGRRLGAAGVIVIDDSGVFRMEPDVPLVVPEVNAQALKAMPRGIVSIPNCTTTPLVMALKPLLDAAGVKRVVVTTFQSVSGTGAAAMDELMDQTKDLMAFRDIKAEVYPYQIAFNLLPHIGSFNEGGDCSEEVKIAKETRKILGTPALRVTATTVRVPVLRCHSEAINVELEQPLKPNEARAALAAMPGVIVYDDPVKKLYPMPLDATGKDEVYIGRVREDESITNGLNLWVVSDNLRKGAALNAIQIAECLVNG
ncbi:MAG: aspartate-semialdehyde dehydrogenase [Nitrospiraceae bacterium]|jgi:aspartate-semialdehyde dehydrogenase|uniref:aspartate-semialdehyde dehydrogenase n=1 Tax=Nitrospira cf. moscoviensis SBR1015 TaxID=96242 RepID=UPI000A0B5900|nr:aspartate-semialdehyde dehydrogenase [Nitrospira cf. moscoviensis SBR1015]MBY0247248.1 aspartate-semialdehyde dehydrogenase [Nitrospiraceae bacterium]OQW36703.1 MAG: aspartate-semialdehyde dehydrogenase [Nitrospira sp. SG-bin2]